MTDADLLARLCRAACCPGGCWLDDKSRCVARRRYKLTVLAVLAELEVGVTEEMVEAADAAGNYELLKSDITTAFTAMLRHLIDAANAAWPSQP